MVNDLNTLMLNETLEALITTTPQGVVVCWTPGAQQLFGYGGAEAAGRLLGELLAPGGEDAGAGADLARREQQVLRQALAEGGARHEALRRTRDGTLVCVDSVGKVCRDRDGAIEYILWSNTDITQTKVQRDARWAEDNFGAVLDLMPEAMLMANDCGRVVLANGHAETLFGYARGQLRGRLVVSLVAGAPDTGGARHGRRRDGQQFALDISASAVPGGLVMHSLRDATQRRRVERDLEEKNRQLEDANRAKDSFLAGMSHELRTPLNAIIGFTGTMLMRLPGPLNADQHKQLNLVQSSARHLVALIDDLVDLTKIEAGKVELAIEALACRPLVEEVLLMFRSAARKKGLGLFLDGCGDAPGAPGVVCLARSARAAGAPPVDDLVVAADRRAVRQIVMNLLANAIKFTDAGAVHVAVRAVRTGQRDSVAISVSDTGVGIGSDGQARLFQAFTQLDARPGRPFEGGSGLGLHLSQKLARLMNGWIAVESEAGTGSVFTLVLPLK